MEDLREEETSPQPLPRPDLDPNNDYQSDPRKLSQLESPVYETNIEETYRVNLATVYEHGINKMDNYNTDLSEYDEKVHIADKYLFPYTGKKIGIVSSICRKLSIKDIRNIFSAEEDHCAMPTLPSNNRLSSRVSNRESPAPRSHRDSPVYSSNYRDSPSYPPYPPPKPRDSPILHRESLSQRASPHFSTSR